MVSKTSNKSKQKIVKNHIGAYSLKEVLNLLGKEKYGKDFLFENHLGKIGDDYGKLLRTLDAADSLIKAMFFEVTKDDGVLFKEDEELFMIEQDGKTVSDFKIPKEQFDYFLRTKKQFITQNVDSLGSIIKKCSFQDNIARRLMQVGTKDNLISYFELVESYKGSSKNPNLPK